MKENILKDHANGMILADIAKKYKITAEELVDIIIESGSEEVTTEISSVEFDTPDNTEVQEQEPSDIVLSIIPTEQESIPQHYMPTHNDVFMDLIIFGLCLDDVCSKYDITKGDVGIMLEEIYKDLSVRVIPMDDVKEAIKRICAEVYLARFN